MTINCNEDFENDIDYQNIVVEKLLILSNN